MRRNQVTKNKERKEINNRLKDIGKEIGVVLSKLHKQQSEAWLEDIKGWQRIVKTEEKRTENKHKKNKQKKM